MMKLAIPVAAVMASAAAAPGMGGMMVEDCSKSTAPHSNRCLMDWWHNAGCTSKYVLSEEAGWVNDEDIYNIKKEMQDVYKKAAAADAAAADVEKCQPIPKEQKRQQDCYVALQNDCKDCFVGPMNMLVNSTCTANCIDDSESLQKKCVNLYNAIQCDRKVNELCGDCVSTGFLGIPMVDPQCFTDCYQKNNGTIRDACPLPEPLQKVKDCHDKLADVCKDCVTGEHDLDGECIASCWTENEATLNKTCPVELGQLAGFLNSGDDSALLNQLASSLSNGGGDVTEIANLFDAGNSQSAMGMGQGDLQGVLSQVAGAIQSLFGQLFNGQQQPSTGSDGSQQPITFTIAPVDNSQGSNNGAPQGQAPSIQDILSQLGFAPQQQQTTGDSSQPQQQGQNIEDILAELGFAPQQPQQQQPQQQQEKPTKKPAQDSSANDSSSDDMSGTMAPVDSNNSASSSDTTGNTRTPAAADEQPTNALQELFGGRGQQ